MTNNSGKKKPLKKKFNSLHLGGTLYTRKDAVETSYVNGVYDQFGKKVMRALTNEEKEWLEKFYQEEVNCTFEKSEKSEELHKEYKSLKKKHKKYKKVFNEEHKDVVKVQQELEAEWDRLGSFNPSSKERSKIYNNDYLRREDLFTATKALGDLINFDLQEYDRFTSEALDHIDPEDILIAKLKK